MNGKEQINQAKKLAAGPLGEQLAKFPLLFAKAILFGQRPSKSRVSEIHNGSVSLVNLGDGPLAVTCEHVISGYRDMKETHSDVVFQIGDVELDPCEQLIDANIRLDIATIRLTNNQTKAITSTGPIGSCIFEPKEWPPPPLNEGEYIAFGGFPGSLRTLISFDEYVFYSWTSGASQVSSVSDGQFVSPFDREFWVSSFGTKHHLDLSALGGLSGGPAFINRGLYWDFVGIVSQYHENYDAMFFASACRLRTDGSIEMLPV